MKAIFSLIILLTLLTNTAYAQKLHVAFIVPDRPAAQFWFLQSQVAQNVATDLDINLELIWSDGDRFGSLKAVTRLVKRQIKPDFVILRPFQGTTVKVFNLLEESKIPFVSLEQAYNEEEKQIIDEPQKKYKSWLAQIHYDNKVGGELLVNNLIKQHQVIHPNTKAFVTGLSGNFDSVSNDRNAGLRKAIGSNKTAELNQIFNMFWKTSVVIERFDKMVKRYPNTNIYWSAGDEMALGLLAQLREHNFKLDDHSIFIGGFDWVPEALEKIKQKELSASAGGHFLMASHALLSIFDFHNGIDRFNESRKGYHFELIDRDNIDVYLPFLQQAPWPNIDFKIFSSVKMGSDKVKTLSVKSLVQEYQAIASSTH